MVFTYHILDLVHGWPRAVKLEQLTATLASEAELPQQAYFDDAWNFIVKILYLNKPMSEENKLKNDSNFFIKNVRKKYLIVQPAREEWANHGRIRL